MLGVLREWSSYGMLGQYGYVASVWAMRMHHIHTIGRAYTVALTAINAAAHSLREPK